MKWRKMLVSPRYLSFLGITAFLLFLIVSLHKWRPPSHSMASVPPHAPSPSPSPPDGNAATDINPVASAGNSTLGVCPKHFHPTTQTNNTSSKRSSLSPPGRPGDPEAYKPPPN
jgi:hypothetical protein